MKAVIINIMMLVALATTSFHVVAQSEPHDTVYFFKTWNQMLKLKPKVMVIDPVIQQNSHDEFEFIAVDPKLTQTMANKYIAARIGDGDWLINSEYLKMCFEGDVRRLNGYIPLFFNDKMAFAVRAAICGWPVPASDIIFYGAEDEGEPFYRPYFYYLDFARGKVTLVTQSSLAGLLEDYHDLKMRYEGMRDYKNPEIIEDYFYRYIDRISQDDSRPRILDFNPSTID